MRHNIRQGRYGGGTNLDAFTIVEVEEPPFMVTNDKFYNSIIGAFGEDYMLKKPLLLTRQQGAFCWIVTSNDVACMGDRIFMKFSINGEEQIIKYTNTAPYMVNLFYPNDKGKPFTNFFNEKVQFGNSAPTEQILTFKQGIEYIDIILLIEILHWLDFIDVGDDNVSRRLRFSLTGLPGLVFCLSILLPSDKKIEIDNLLFDNETVTFGIETASIQ